MLSSKGSKEKSNSSNENGSIEKVNDRVKVITTKIPMKGELIKEIEKQTNCISVKMPVVPVNLAEPSSSSFGSEESEENITVPAKERKTITTVRKTCPTKVQTLVVEELDPIVTVNVNNNKKVTEVRTPIKKKLTTTTTVKRTTLVTTETTTIIGPENKKSLEGK